MKKDVKNQKQQPLISKQIVVNKQPSNKTIYAIIFALTFGLYGNTLLNEYALDDSIVILQNEFTKKGFRGIDDIFKYDTFTGFFGVQKNLVAGGRYRPLSLLTFAIEYQLFGQNPFISHLINILLYALTGILIFLILSKLLIHFQARKWYLSIPFLTTVLFIAHPVHTEVIANIKGRDEIMTLLGALFALQFTLKYLETEKIKYLGYSAIVFFLALLSKENAITFIAVIPLTIHFFTNYSTKKNLFTVVPLLLATFVFLGIRQAVLGSPTQAVTPELMNDPFLYATLSEKYATIFYTLGIYIKLLFFPLTLTYDYYPFHIPIVGWADWRAATSLIVYLAMGIYALMGLKKKSIISYGIWIYLITLSIVSNLFFPVGSFMNERFIYLPSIGFCLIIAYFLLNKLPLLIKKETTYRNVFAGIVFVILCFSSIKTISRNSDWKNDFTLFTHDVKISSNSAKSNCSAGGKLTEEAVKPGNESKREEYLTLAIKYLEKSISIHPPYSDALLLLGNAHYEYNEDLDKTLFYYKKILVQNKDYERVWANIFSSKIVANFDDPKKADHNIELLEDLYTINPDRYELNYKLGNIYGRFKNNLEKSIPYLEKAAQINPSKADAYKDLGVAYGIKGDFNKSIGFLEKATTLDPKDFQILMNLGVSYQQIGNVEKSQFYINKAKELEKSMTAKK